MKIVDMSFKDRFDDLLEKITGIQEGLVNETDEADVDIKPELQELSSLFRRLIELRDDVLEKN